jgi:hypothetical protein
VNKRSTRHWPFRPHADPLEDPLHDDTTFGTHPERARGAEIFEPTFVAVATIAVISLDKPVWPEWEAARAAGILG